MTVMSKNPFGEFRRECVLTLGEALEKTLSKNIVSDQKLKERGLVSESNT